MKQKKRKAEVLDGMLVVIAAGLLLFFGWGTFFLPQESFSERENRVLSVWEMPSWNSFFDGSFSTYLGKFYRDQLPLRSQLISLKAGNELLLGKRENNGIFWGEDGYLMARKELYDRSTATKNLSAVEAFFSACQESEIDTAVLWVPRSSDVLWEYLPKAYPKESSVEALKWVAEASERGILLRSELRQAQEGGTQVYYKTDHHWTTDGAYLAYVALGERLGFVPRGRDFFDREVVSTSFLGSADSAVGGIAPMADEIVLYRYAGDTSYSVIHGETGDATEGFYRFEALSEKDQYRIFLGGNFAHLRISDGTEKPRLLLVKDSFANSLVPFLALHFEIDMVDLRYGALSISELMEQNEYDKILVVQGIDTLFTDPSLQKIKS